MDSPICFYGRKRELAALDERYRTSHLELVPIYGRRRVGKTYLLREFARDKGNVLFFTARQTSAHENLVGLSRAIDTQVVRPSSDQVMRPSSEGGSWTGPIYASFEEALLGAVEMMGARREHLGRPLVIIDEYPYLASSDPSVSSVLQSILDGLKGESDLMLILCGSSMSFMEHQVLGRESPLYGRRTAQIKLEPFDALDAAGLLRAAQPAVSLAPQLAVELYGIVGGIPLYLEQFDIAASIEENLARCVFRQDAFLYGEPATLLLEEVRDPASYNAVLGAVASGRTRQGEISAASGINANTTSAFLRRLGELRIVGRWRPVPSDFGGRPLYRLVDNLFGFWHGVTARYASAIEADMGTRVAERVTADALPTYLGSVFEDVCRQWLVREIGALVPGALPVEVGKWWGVDPVRRERADIDVAITTHDGPLVLGECKWTREAVDVGVLRALERRAAIFGVDVRLFCFATSGFTEGARTYARERSNLTLVSVDEMLPEG